jgi:enoyl-CoA hydratase/carnithine racemase
MSETVISELREGVRILSLNRPERHNALDDETSELFQSHLERAFGEPESRVILIRGEGKSFCSGRDISVLGHRARDESDFHFVRRHQQARLGMLDCIKPIVAAVKGAALGGGCEMALAADIRVASTDLKMGMPEINYGLLPDTGGTQYLAVLVGPSRAKYLVLSGDRIDGKTALEWGAIDFLVAPEELDERAFAIARNMASKPPIALAMGKQMIDQGHIGAIKAGIGAELLAQTALFRTDDYAEARAALRERRAPVYKGR